MLIQLIIFITKTKIFACEINSNGKAETISIKGNTEIKCEGKESADELIACIFDRFNIDDFADDNFDIVIIESDADREVIKYLEMKCGGATKFNIICMEKILPVIASGKYLIKVGEEITVAFAEQFYKIACDKNAMIKITAGNQDKKAVLLRSDDFAIFFNYKLVENNNGNDKKILNYEKEIKGYKQTILDLNKKMNDLQKELEVAKKSQTIKTKKESVAKIPRKSTEKNISGSTKDLKLLLEKHGDIFESTPEYNGYFYISGSIPTSKLPDNVFTKDLIFSSSSACSFLISFQPKTSLALYCSEDYNDSDDALRYLLITRDGIFYFANMSGEIGFVYWDSISDIVYENVFKKKYISLSLKNGRSIRFCGIDVTLKNKNSTQEFLFNLLRDLRQIKK